MFKLNKKLLKLNKLKYLIIDLYIKKSCNCFTIDLMWVKIYLVV